MIESDNIGCEEFEELLSDYLEKKLGRSESSACAAHVLSCTSCHELLEDVKIATQACTELSAPESRIPLLESRILKQTVPERLISCAEFEEHVTDYLDGFLEAAIFHRWSRHSATCEECSNLPGAVVRSIAACYSMKAEELEAPEGLVPRVIEATVGAGGPVKIRIPLVSALTAWTRTLTWPAYASQMVSVAAILLFAMIFLVSESEVSADGSVRGVYEKGFELASETYRQGADAMLGGLSREAGAPEASEDNSRGDSR